MKKLIIAALAGIIMVAGCKKEKSTTQVVKIPHMELVGTAVYSTPVGTGSYSDPGAKLTDENGAETTLTTPTSSNVDLTTPGFYSATYSKRTQYGYDLSVSRLILVTSVSPAHDYSGIYARTSNSQTVIITKQGTGLYTTDNVGGVAGNSAFIFDTYFGLINDTTVIIPPQTGPATGDFVGANGKLVITAIDTTFEWQLIGSAFGTSLRKFVKQP